MTRIERTRGGATQILDLNLLPAAQRPADASPAMVIIVAGILIAIFAIAPLALRLSHAKDKADAVGQQARYAEQALHGVQVDLAQHGALQAELATTKSQLDRLAAERAQLQGGRRPLVEDLTELSRADRLPPGVRLKTVAGTDSGLRVEGVAPGPLDAIAYAERLMRDAGFTSARLLSFAPAASGGQFVIEVSR